MTRPNARRPRRASEVLEFETSKPMAHLALAEAEVDYLFAIANIAAYKAHLYEDRMCGDITETEFREGCDYLADLGQLAEGRFNEVQETAMNAQSVRHA